MEVLGIKKIKAVVFDMDGVLIDSEPLWRKAEIAVFSKYDIKLTEDDCKRLMGLRTDEVVKQILIDFSANFSVTEITAEVLDAVCERIRFEGSPVTGFPELVKTLTQKKIPMAVATSSPMQVVNTVLEKLGLTVSFYVVISAEHFPYGKPHPQVYIEACKALGFLPSECIAIEDSVNGIISAKSARMSVIAIPDNESKGKKEFALADYIVERSDEVAQILNTLLF